MATFYKRAACWSAALFLSAACGRGQPSTAAAQPAGAPHIVLSQRASGAAAIDVVGLPPSVLSQLERHPPSRELWAALLRVAVAGTSNQPAMLGAYSIEDGALRFTPQFPFDPGQAYTVVFEPVALPTPTTIQRLETTIDVKGAAHRASTRVTEVYPTAAEIPANQLRLYILFSAPMGLKSGLEHVRLIDEHGRAVEDPFLPLDVDLWDETRTRFTLLFDPGRVKRGILPNEMMGRSLIAGRMYVLVVDADWRDAAGEPLVSAFRREFRVGPPEERALDPVAWKIGAPSAGTRDPVTVSFPRPLDYGLLRHALTVSRGAGERLDGEIQVEGAETRWLFTPREPWGAGEHRLSAASTLEDGAGNRIGRAFEATTVDKTPGAQRPRSAVLPFQISPSARGLRP